MLNVIDYAFFDSDNICAPCVHDVKILDEEEN